MDWGSFEGREAGTISWEKDIVSQASGIFCPDYRSSQNSLAKTNVEAEIKWCLTRAGHKMARPCVRKGQLSPDAALAAIALQL